MRFGGIYLFSIISYFTTSAILAHLKSHHFHFLVFVLRPVMGVWRREQYHKLKFNIFVTKCGRPLKRFKKYKKTFFFTYLLKCGDILVQSRCVRQACLTEDFFPSNVCHFQSGGQSHRTFTILNIIKNMVFQEFQF